MNEKSIILKKVFIDGINNTNDGFSIEYINIIENKKKSMMQEINYLKMSGKPLFLEHIKIIYLK